MSTIFRFFSLLCISTNLSLCLSSCMSKSDKLLIKKTQSSADTLIEIQSSLGNLKREGQLPGIHSDDIFSATIGLTESSCFRMPLTFPCYALAHNYRSEADDLSTYCTLLVKSSLNGEWSVKSAWKINSIGLLSEIK